MYRDLSSISKDKKKLAKFNFVGGIPNIRPLTTVFLRPVSRKVKNFISDVSFSIR